MQDKTNLKSLFSSLQEEMLAQANFSQPLPHPTDKGDNAEKSWLQWFKAYLPDRYKVSKATVIDSRGNLSDQIDVVIYDRQYSYLAFNQNDVLCIPAESVYAVFEVKQNLNKEHMQYAAKKAESVRKLYRTSAPIPHAGGTFKPKELHHIIAGILTTTSEWNPAFGESFCKCWRECDVNQQLDCGCVLQSGSFCYDSEKNLLEQSEQDEALVSFFMHLLILLQKLGTVPAIDLSEYMKALTIQKCDI